MVHSDRPKHAYLSPETHSVGLRAGFRKQSLSLDEPLCRDLMLPHFPLSKIGTGSLGWPTEKNQDESHDRKGGTRAHRAAAHLAATASAASPWRPSRRTQWRPSRRTRPAGEEVVIGDDSNDEAGSAEHRHRNKRRGGGKGRRPTSCFSPSCAPT